MSEEEMHTTIDINLPKYAAHIVTTEQILEAISSVQTISDGRLQNSLTLCLDRRVGWPELQIVAALRTARP